MDLSVGNIIYLGLVIAGFTFFIAMLAITSLRCNGFGSRKGDEAPPRSDLQVEPEALKPHGDKLSHSMDLTAG